MKICPQCQKSYDDMTLNFCLEDGSVLNDASATVDQPPATVMMGDAPRTAPNQPIGTQTDQKTLDAIPRYQSAASSGSKSWIWVLGILLGVVLICGGGFVGLIAIGSMVEDEDTPIVDGKVPNKPDTPVGDVPPTVDNRKLVHSHNFSKWNLGVKKGASATYENGELVIKTRRRSYYVLLTKGYKTKNASVKITLRNIDNRAAPLGYGLVFHSDPKVLSSDYAFLIRSDNQKYRIVRHNNRKEITVIKWTRSSAINAGSKANDLEIRSDGRDTSFYINGKFIRTEKRLSGLSFGVAGIYTSSDSPIGFSYIEYRK